MRPVRALSLADMCVLAESSAGAPAEVVYRSAGAGRAAAALAAPFAAFGGEDLHPSLHDKAAALCWHFARNHPLADGNKRTAWVLMAVFVELNGGAWSDGQPDTAEAEQVMVAVAAGSCGKDELAGWLRQRVAFR